MYCQQVVQLADIPALVLPLGLVVGRIVSKDAVGLLAVVDDQPVGAVPSRGRIAIVELSPCRCRGIAVDGWRAVERLDLGWEEMAQNMPAGG